MQKGFIIDNSSNLLFKTPANNEIMFMKIPNLNLFVITDCKNFGSNWIEVKVVNKIYTTKCLLGENPDLFSCLARRFAEDILESQAKFVEEEFISLESKSILLNISLRDTSYSEVQEIGKNIRNFQKLKENS